MATVDEARREVQRLTDAHSALTGKRAAVEAALQEARQQAATDVLEAQLTGADTAGKARRVSELADEAAAIAGALAELATRQRAAAGRLKAAQAANLRSQAEDLRSQAAKRQKVTAGLLAQLRKHEGLDYMPYLRADGGGVIPQVPYLLWPEISQRYTGTGQLEAQAAGLEAQAAELERELRK